MLLFYDAVDYQQQMEGKESFAFGIDLVERSFAMKALFQPYKSNRQRFWWPKLQRNIAPPVN